MNFYTRKVSSILTDIQEINRMGLTTLKQFDVNNEHRKVEYQVRWLGMSRGFHPEILSKKGMTLRGTGSSCYTYSHNVREWKILPQDYETLEKFVIGFKVINSLSTNITPDVGKPETDVNVILVPEPPVPAVSALRAPFKVV